LDANRFDVWVRSLHVVAPRRSTLGGGLGAALTIVFSSFGTVEMAARKKKKKKKKPKNPEEPKGTDCEGGTKACGKKCIPKAECCDPCPAGQACVNGACACTPGSCPGGCCDGTTCVAAGDCCPTPGTRCRNGVCSTPVATLADCGGRCDCPGCGSDGPASITVCGKSLPCPNCSASCQGSLCPVYDTCGGSGFYCFYDVSDCCPCPSDRKQCGTKCWRICIGS
jgi:hypothetical protein